MVSHMQRILLPAGTNSCISISLTLQMGSLFFLLKKIKFVACLQFSGREVQRSRTKCIEYVWVPLQKKEKWYTLCTDCHCILAFKYSSLQFWMKFFMWFYVVCDEMLNQTFMWWNVNFLLHLGLGWNDRAVYMGCVNEAQIGSMRLLPHCSPCGAMSLPCQQLCYQYRQITRHHCHPRHLHVNSHVILHVIDVWHGNWIRDENYIVCDVYFRHRKRAWVGLWGPRDILWRFHNVMNQAIHDENLRNVTRCDLWHSIHDAISDRHR